MVNKACGLTLVLDMFLKSVSPDKSNCSSEENQARKVQGGGECHSFEGD
jgi:hypothetical protein